MIWDQLQRIGGSLFGGQGGDASPLQNFQDLPVMEWLQKAGIDPAQLEQLSAGQAMELLSKAGVDVSSLSQAQLGELLQNLPGGALLGSIDLQRFLGR
jgi:hypothetical protein